MPTNTDLVTDLPADFAVFGQAVDTSMADLLGGTTGQILAKASNTNMDFAWIANDQGDITGITATSPLTGGGTSGAVTVGIQSASTSQSGAVQLSDSTSTTSSILASTPTATKAAYDLANTANTTANAAVAKSTVTAKGSIFTATASATPAQIAVGNNGEVLVADSSTSTGLRYQASAIGKNCVFNSGFDIFQRTSAPTTGITTAGGVAYSLDRWVSWAVTGTGSMNASQQVTGDTTNLPFVRYCARIQRTAGNTSTSLLQFAQALENTDSARFLGQTVTFSFYARKGATYSGVSNTLAVIVQTGTGTDQSWWNMTGTAQPINTSATLTSTWQRFQYTATLSSTATQLGFAVGFNGVGTAGATDYFEVTAVQLELGSIATPFAKMGSGTVQSELSSCQRYYQRNTVPTAAYAALSPAGWVFSNYRGTWGIPLSVPMRATPTSLDTGNIACLKAATDTRYSTGTWALGGSNGTNNSIQEVFYSHGTGVFTQGDLVVIQTNSASNQYIGFSAELS